MTRAHIQTRVWLSIGIFVLGFLIATIVWEIRVKTRTHGDCVTVSISEFFATKEVGHGTGQGLALARSIVVEKHGGRIAFEPNLPQGTTFVVSVPIGQPDAVSPDAPRLEESIA